MAQHMEVRNPKASKVLQRIGASIEKTAKAGGISRGSLKWELLGLDPYTGCHVWQTSRYIGKGIVWGDTKGTFEVYVKGRYVQHVFLVA